MNNIPLAERLRPRTLDDVIGQQHLLGPGKPLRVAFESGEPHSMILWGPPGVGKTTLARLMADSFQAEFIALSAVLSGVKDIREAVERAQVFRANSGRRTILFVDEVHRFNKSQQDAFLPHVESGLFTFIGATTENPSFEVNGALLSRAAVYVLKSLSDEDLDALVDRACIQELEGLDFAPEAKATLIASADGDGRKLLNNLEIVARAAAAGGRQEVDEALLATALAENLRRFDKGGDAFYDQISALHKSVRGSNPDASLYWFVRMLDGGADPRYLARRIIRMAAEDIGLADPRALRLSLDAAETYERLGSPEGELALAEAVVYLACAAKSNAVYNAYNAARAFVAKDKSRPVPEHLRNAPTKLMKELGYGKLYRYAHDEPDAYAAGETYLPDGMREPNWYQPTPRGLEGKIGEKLSYLRALDRDARKNEKK
ncbi:replication-associated recombination protein A [Noviherbaspirillum sp. CPCC 100848]|uniref:Replication-associated recombination protein A n=1 Tax=Noviherbaspirillum album TaxID=3080276 RepID=A0ABU6JG06_9BURK|nr:replication-associated recombination protein A [Noviherbaspirillum sp. CPCC 100848]MEC4722127.1 replication-associated recombination protein A [Noviherbaspirillum sp. CPCC 100848]